MRSFRRICAWIGIVGVHVLHAQVDSLALRYARSITEEDLARHLFIIASDEYLGRDTGKEGQKMAASYLKEQFIRSGISPVPAAGIVDGYFQPFEVVEMRSGTIALTHGERNYQYGKQIFYTEEHLTQDRTVAELVFVPERTHLPDDQLVGKAVLMYPEAPVGSGSGMWSGIRKRLDALRVSGVSMILVCVDDLAGLMAKMHVTDAHMRLVEHEKRPEKEVRPAQVVLVERTALEEIIGGRPFARAVRKGKVQRFPVTLNVEVTSGEKLLTTENVLAYIAGSDKKDELVVLTAHYDHVGVKDGVVYNGADDDGSGTVAMIEIAEAFAQAKAAGHGPRRSVLVMAVSGEEKGLLGSRYYSEHPVFPLSNTVADLNIDMIGRRDSMHQTSPPYVYVIGSDRLSSGLHEANEQANKTYTKLDLDYTFNAENDPNRFYYRSDHYNFARKGIPSLFYFSGVHEDYHQPGDDAEKIEIDLLHQRTLLAFHTAWILANQESRIVVDKPVKP